MKRSLRRLANAWRGKAELSEARQSARLGEADPKPSAPIDIAEITPQQGRVCPGESARLNLLVPTLRAAHVFGGISTALTFFAALIKDDSDARIILTDDAQAPDPLPPSLGNWTAHKATADDVGGRHIIPFGARADVALPVRRHDVFVATAWWTAYTTQRLIGWQTDAYGVAPPPLIYLIQDYEPAFYPPSTRHCLAQSTYDYAGPMMGVFNTALLRDYFHQQGLTFARSFTFEPQLNPILASLRRRSSSARKERRMILYGRPSVPRNAFELMCLGLRHWSAGDTEAGQWRIESLGESHQDIPLHNGAVIVSRGKVSLEAYAETLSRASIGVSLMLSPHPSYPPLEMAEFGVHVITSRYANKDLSGRSSFIHSLYSMTPETLSAELAALTAPWRKVAERDQPLPESSLFCEAGSAFPFVEELRESMAKEGGGD
jgi:hypothetical protein